MKVVIRSSDQGWLVSLVSRMGAGGGTTAFPSRSDAIRVARAIHPGLPLFQVLRTGEEIPILESDE